MTELHLGIRVTPIYYSDSHIKYEDIHHSLIKLTPYLTKTLISHLKSPIQAVKISAVKGIDYLLENLGCTLDNPAMIDILKAFIESYPESTKEEDKRYRDFNKAY